MDKYIITAHEVLTEDQAERCRELIGDLDESISFGDRLKLLRTQAGLTQKQLAERIGATKSMISYYELQERQPSSVSLKKLSEAFHVSTDYLLGLENNETIDVSGLDEEDIRAVRQLVGILRKKSGRL